MTGALSMVKFCKMAIAGEEGFQKQKNQKVLKRYKMREEKPFKRLRISRTNVSRFLLKHCMQGSRQKPFH